MTEYYDIVTWPDKRLNQSSEKVEAIDDSIRAILDRMTATLYKEEGLGVAAVQVGVMKKLIVIDIDKEASKDIPDWQNLHNGKALKMVNAEVIEASDERNSRDEACMSLPYIAVHVERPKRIKVRYLDENGQEQTIEADGTILAACLQHEIDHTNGILTIDHASQLKKGMLIKKMEKYLKSLKNKQ